MRKLPVKDLTIDSKIARKAEAATMLAEDFKLDPETLEFLKTLITVPGISSTHILLHGPKGAGKNQLARFLAEAVKWPAFEVRFGQSTENFRENIVMAHDILGSGPGHILIIDNAEEILSQSTFDGPVKYKNFKGTWNLSVFMSQKEAACFWIVESLEDIDESILEIFDYNVKFEKLGATERLRLWRKQQATFKRKLLPDDSLRRLANEFDVNEDEIKKFFNKTWKIESQDAKKAELWLKNNYGHIWISWGGDLSL
ncbi:MAG: AAA family ATPase [Deltaproteobacteria bacterium]|nr:AAA family ATPase [Deltaproteobacteria bacterium]